MFTHILKFNKLLFEPEGVYHIENSMIDQGTTMLLVNSIEK